MASTASISRAALFSAAAVISLSAPTVHAAPMASSRAVSLDEFRQLKQASGWVALSEKLHCWAGLSDDWDTEGAVAPDLSTIAAAHDFLVVLERQGAPMPAASIAADGEVAFEWTAGEGFASASFTDDGHFIAYLREDGDAPVLRIDELAELAPTGPFLERIGAFA